MRVRALKNFSGGLLSFMTGQEADINEAQAAVWISEGLLEAVEAEKPAKATTTEAKAEAKAPAKKKKAVVKDESKRADS